MPFIVLVINYMQKSYEYWAKKYIKVNFIDLNLNMTIDGYDRNTETRWLVAKLLLARKENKNYILIYTPNERKDIVKTLLEVDARIRNIVNTIEIE